MKKVKLENYKKDRYYPKIIEAVDSILETSIYISPIGVFKSMGLLKQIDIDNWRKGRVPYLEKVIQCNLSKASRILRILSFHAHDLNLKPSFTIYKRKTKNGKILLKFSKTGDNNLEKAYSKHFVKTGKKKTDPPIGIQ